MTQILLSLLKTLSKTKGFLGNLMAMLIVAAFGAYYGIQYVEAKSVEVEKKVIQNAVQIKALNQAKQQTATALTLINSNLKNMNETLKDFKISIDDGNKQTVQIYRDLLKLKTGG